MSKHPFVLEETLVSNQMIPPKSGLVKQRVFGLAYRIMGEESLTET